MNAIREHAYDSVHVSYPQAYHREYGHMDRFPLDDGSVVLTERRECRGTKNTVAAHHWLLLPSGVAAGFLHLYRYHRAQWPLVLADVEVRPEYRGGGLVRELVTAVETYWGGLPLHTTGSFTPEGARALDFLPLMPTGEAPGVKFDSMAFVKDWHNLIPVHGL